jgi:glycine/D-amino acid oxidase-like deaminating enzyme
VERCDVVIVGGGIAGLATAWALSKERGQRVVLLERAPQPGAGSSGKSAAILRTFDDDPVNRVLSRAGGGLLASPPPDLAGRSLVAPCGLVLGVEGERAQTLGAELERSALPGEAEELTPDRLDALAPHVAQRPERAFLFPGDGRIEVDALLGSLARAVRAAGVELRTGCTVGELLRAGSTVDGVRLDDGAELRGSTTVLAAGGWAGTLGRRAGSRVALRPTRRHLLVTKGRAARFGTLAHGVARARGLLLPAGGRRPPGLRLRRGGRRSGDVPARRGRAARARHGARDRPQGAARAARGRHALERAFLVRRAHAHGRRARMPRVRPGSRRTLLVAGLGGHGMSAGLAMGRLAAALLYGQPHDREIARALSPARLARGAQVGAGR